MATRYSATDMDSTAVDSVTSTPRSEHHHHLAADEPPPVPARVRLMCSFGGKILPRPHDNQLRYVGGDTRIVAVSRHASFSSLHSRLSKIAGAGAGGVVVKYQLPNEELDSLITVSTDEDVENMMEEYDRVAGQGHKSARLRLFLFPTDAESRASAIDSILDGSTNRQNWFVDALNGPGSGLERGRSEASSIISEVPDYLFGLEHPDDPTRIKNKHIFHETSSNSDPGSPAPVISSPFCSTSSPPNLPPVKTKPDKPKEVSMETGEKPVQHQQSGYTGSPNPIWHYPGPPHVQPVPVYYVPGVGPVHSIPQPGQAPYVQPGTHPVHSIPQPGQAPYVQPYQVIPGQVPVGLPRQVSNIAQVYEPVLYEVRNGGTVPGYSSTGEEMDAKTGRIPNAP